MSEIKITNSTAKTELLKEWAERKGDDAWTLEEIAELIADATWLSEERIIELLKDTRNNCACYEVGMPICRHTPTVDETIALIKGENK